MKKYVVYSISLNGEVKYVGKTSGFRERKRQHLKYRGDRRHSAIPVDVDLNLISFAVLEEIEDRYEALRVEDKYILQYQTLQEQGGWNIHRSGLIKRDNEKEYKVENATKWRKEHIERTRETHNAWLRKYYHEHREEECARNRNRYAKKKAEKLSQPSS